jgi:DNA-binding CsgD family transcriptional regulator
MACSLFPVPIFGSPFRKMNGALEMKVKYRNSDTTIIELDVAEDVAVTLETCYREEDNLARKWRYHHYSLDAVEYEGMEYAAPDTPESIMLEMESNERCNHALAQLTDVQRRRFIMFMAGLSTHDIARREGANQKSVHESIEAARKKLKKFF